MLLKVLGCLLKEISSPHPLHTLQHQWIPTNLAGSGQATPQQKLALRKCLVSIINFCTFSCYMRLHWSNSTFIHDVVRRSINSVVRKSLMKQTSQVKFVRGMSSPNTLVGLMWAGITLTGRWIRPMCCNVSGWCDILERDTNNED